MNILFVHEVDWLRKVVFEIHTFSELLSLRGHRVYAVDYESMWVREGPLDFGGLGTRTVEGVARAYPGASVSLVRPGFIKIPGVSRLSAFFTQGREIGRIIREEHIDAVILYSVPTSGLQTLRHAGKSGVPVIFRSIDILNSLVSSPLLSPVTRLVERRVYSGADLVLTISPRLSRYVTGLGAPEESVRLLPLGVDTETFRPEAPDKELRRRWGLGEGPVIVFIGTLYEFSGLDAVVRRLPEIVAETPGVKLLIVGDGPQRAELERVITETGVGEQAVITGFQPFEEMPQYLNLAEVCISPFRVNDVTRDIFPTKVVQYLACGKPVVATRLPGLEEAVAGEEQGMVYADSPGEVAAEIISLLKSGERRRRLGQAARRYAEQTHGYDRITRQLEEILTGLTGGGKTG